MPGDRQLEPLTQEQLVVQTRMTSKQTHTLSALCVQCSVIAQDQINTQCA